jgi:hypothetical protein
MTDVSAPTHLVFDTELWFEKAGKYYTIQDVFDVLDTPDFDLYKMTYIAAWKLDRILKHIFDHSRLGIYGEEKHKRLVKTKLICAAVMCKREEEAKEAKVRTSEVKVPN